MNTQTNLTLEDIQRRVTAELEDLANPRTRPPQTNVVPPEVYAAMKRILTEERSVFSDGEMWELLQRQNRRTRRAAAAMQRHGTPLAEVFQRCVGLRRDQRRAYIMAQAARAPGELHPPPGPAL